MIGRFWVITEDLAPVQLRMEYMWSTRLHTITHISFGLTNIRLAMKIAALNFEFQKLNLA